MSIFKHPLLVDYIALKIIYKLMHKFDHPLFEFN
jgi:hypothetical protein